MPKKPELEHFRAKSLSDLTTEQAAEYNGLLTKFSIELGKNELSTLIETSDSLEPLFHIHQLCKNGKISCSEKRMKQVEALVVSIFAGKIQDSASGATKTEKHKAGFFARHLRGGGELLSIHSSAEKEFLTQLDSHMLDDTKKAISAKSILINVKRNPHYSSHWLSAGFAEQTADVANKLVEKSESAAKKKTCSVFKEILRNQNFDPEQTMTPLYVTATAPLGSAMTDVLLSLNNLLSNQHFDQSKDHLGLFSDTILALQNASAGRQYDFQRAYSDLNKITGDKHFDPDTTLPAIKSIAEAENKNKIPDAIIRFRELLQNERFDPEKMMPYVDQVISQLRIEQTPSAFNFLNILVENRYFVHSKEQKNQLHRILAVASKMDDESSQYFFYSLSSLTSNPKTEFEKQVSVCCSVAEHLLQTVAEDSRKYIFHSLYDLVSNHKNPSIPTMQKLQETVDALNAIPGSKNWQLAMLNALHEATALSDFKPQSDFDTFVSTVSNITKNGTNDNPPFGYMPSIIRYSRSSNILIQLEQISKKSSGPDLASAFYGLESLLGSQTATDEFRKMAYNIISQTEGAEIGKALTSLSWLLQNSNFDSKKGHLEAFEKGFASIASSDSSTKEKTIAFHLLVFAMSNEYKFQPDWLRGDMPENFLKAAKELSKVDSKNVMDLMLTMVKHNNFTPDWGVEEMATYLVGLVKTKGLKVEVENKSEPKAAKGAASKSNTEESKLELPPSLTNAIRDFIIKTNADPSRLLEPLDFAISNFDEKGTAVAAATIANLTHTAGFSIEKGHLKELELVFEQISKMNPEESNAALSALQCFILSSSFSPEKDHLKMFNEIIKNIHKGAMGDHTEHLKGLAQFVLNPKFDSDTMLPIVVADYKYSQPDQYFRFLNALLSNPNYDKTWFNSEMTRAAFPALNAIGDRKYSGWTSLAVESMVMNPGFSKDWLSWDVTNRISRICASVQESAGPKTEISFDNVDKFFKNPKFNPSQLDTAIDILSRVPDSSLFRLNVKYSALPCVGAITSNPNFTDSFKKPEFISDFAFSLNKLSRKLPNIDKEILENLNAILSNEKFTPEMMDLIHSICRKEFESVNFALSGFRSLLNSERFNPETHTEKFRNALEKLGSDYSNSWSMSLLSDLIATKDFDPNTHMDEFVSFLHGLSSKAEEIDSKKGDGAQQIALMSTFKSLHSFLCRKDFEVDTGLQVIFYGQNIVLPGHISWNSYFEAIMSVKPDEKALKVLAILSEVAGGKEKTIRNLPSRSFDIFLYDLFEKSDVILSLKPKNDVTTKNRDGSSKVISGRSITYTEAVFRIANKIKAEEDEFYGSLLKGESPKSTRMLMSVLSRLDDEFNKDLESIAKKLGYEEKKLTPQVFQELCMSAQEKYAPVFELPTKSVSKKLQVKDILLTLPEEVDESLRLGLSAAMDSFKENEGEKLSQLITKTTEINDILSKDKEEIAAFMRSNNIDDKKVQAFLDGKMPEENVRQLLLKTAGLEMDLSLLVWLGVKKAGKEDLVEEYCKGDNFSKSEMTELAVFLREFDTPMADALSDIGLGSLMPAAKSSASFKEIINARDKLTEIKSRVEGAERSYTMVFSSNLRMLDLFYGVHAGTCFGDYPAQTMARKDLVAATLYQNGTVAGGILFLEREINGKNSLVIIGVDPSTIVLGGEGAGAMPSEKQVELINWMLKEVQTYCKDNDFGLYITDTAGGITNRGDIVERAVKKHFGKKAVSLESTGSLHPSYGYTINSAVEFIP